VVTFLLRNVEGKLWKAFRARATREGRTLRYILIALIAQYVSQGLPPES